MPIVGILIFSIINFDALGDKHSKTIEKAPAFSINLASFSNLDAVSLVFPSTLNFF